MKFLVFRILALAAACMTCGKTFSVIDSLHFHKKDNQYIFSIGELHNFVINPGLPGASIEMRDSCEIMRLFDAITKSKKETTVILEVGPESMRLLQEKQATVACKFGAIAQLALTAEMISRRYPHVHIVFADKRTEVEERLEFFLNFFVSEQLTLFVHVLRQKLRVLSPAEYSALSQQLTACQPLTSMQGCIILDSFLKTSALGREIFFDDENSIIHSWACQLKQLYPETFHEIITQKEQAQARLFGLINSLPLENPCKNFFQDLYSKTDFALTHLKKFFQTLHCYNQHITAIDLVVAALKEKSCEAVAQQWDHANTLTYFFEMDLVHELSVALTKGHHVIMLTGSNHTENLKPLIKSLGFDPVFPDRINLSTADKGTTLSDKELREIFDSIQNAIAPICAVCGKPSTAKCARCKKVFYCSQDCQKKDWSYHKLHCQ